MRRRGETQFEVFDNPRTSKRIQGFAVDMSGGSVIANTEIQRASTWDQGSPAKVSWAMANRQGRAMAAPHLLTAAMSAHTGITPHADYELSPEGSRMSRSAARRGLILPHPNNPEMKPTMGAMTFEGDDEEIDVAIQRHMLSNYSYAHEKLGRPHVFSEAQMGAAHARVFNRKRVPYKAWSEISQ